MKRAYDQGKLDKKWIEDYCWNGGKGCVRKMRFESEGYVSPDYVLPDGSVDEDLRKWVERNESQPGIQICTPDETPVPPER